MTNGLSSQVRIAVQPIAEFNRRPRLFRALGRAFDVEFCSSDQPDRTVAGEILVAADQERTERATDAPHPMLIVEPQSSAESNLASNRPTRVAFASTESVNPHLRGRTLDERHIAGARPIDDGTDQEVLATADGAALWTRRREPTGVVTHFSASPLPELDPGCSLRDLVSAGRFAALVPLIQFLRDVSGFHGWERPPVRACLVIDDPNFHATSYGNLSYRRLLALAEQHRFHASIATVPLDAWFVRSAAVDLIAAAPELLSVCVHGNNHTPDEWTRSDDWRDYLPGLRSSFDRMERLRRAGLGYDPIQIAPHNRCSGPAATAMHRFGYEALSITRSFHRRVGHDHPVYSGGWELADCTPDGLPVLVRMHIDDETDDFTLRGFLGVPIIVYGHHWDAADDAKLLVETAERINSLPGIEWMPLVEIARSNVVTRTDDSLLRIRPHSSHAAISVPPNANRLRIELPSDHPWVSDHTALIDDKPVPWEADGSSVVSSEVRCVGGATVDLRIVPDNAVSQDDVSSARLRPVAMARRLATEARDRAVGRGLITAGHD